MSDSARSLLLDSQGLSEAARGTSAARALVVKARRSNVPVVVSAVTLAEVLRGHARDAAVHLLLKGCQVEPVSQDIGRYAGELLATHMTGGALPPYADALSPARYSDAAYQRRLEHWDAKAGQL